MIKEKKNFTDKEKKKNYNMRSLLTKIKIKHKGIDKRAGGWKAHNSEQSKQKGSVKWNTGSK